MLCKNEYQPLVGVFLAGVQKAGTTSLHSYLSAHSGLTSSLVKETHFFDNEGIDWKKPNYDAFHRLFRSNLRHAIPFESTPIYTFWPPSLYRIKRYNSNARLILLLRDPIERAYSHWMMEKSRGNEILSFDRAIRDGRTRLVMGPQHSQAWRSFSYIERGLYTSQVQRALALFPRSQLLFIDSERLRRDHTTVLNGIAKFLDLPPFPTLPTQQKNVGLPGAGLKPEDLDYLRSIFSKDVESFSNLTGLDIGQWLTLRRQ